MPSISQYTDPGAFVQEQIVPGSVSVSTVPLTTCLIGIGKRTKKAANEALIRGTITGETLSVGATPGAHTATLINLGNRKSAQTIVYKDGVDIGSSAFSYVNATVTGSTLTTLNFTSANKVSLAIDGKQGMTIAITSVAAWLGAHAYVAGDLVQNDSGKAYRCTTGGTSAGSGGPTGTGTSITDGTVVWTYTTALTAFNGSYALQPLVSISNIAAVTPAQIAEGINTAMAAASWYGTAYGSVATVDTGKVIITSPSTSASASDVKLFTAFPTSESRTADVFGVSLPYTAITTILLTDAVYSSTAAFTADYVSTNSLVDVLDNSDVQSMSRIGNYAGVTSYINNTDYTASSTSVTWAGAAPAFTSSVAAASFNLSTNDVIILSFDGKASVPIDLNGMTSPPPGYANPSSPSAATPAEIVANINAVMASTLQYGPLYRSVATVSGSGASSRIVLTSPVANASGIVEVFTPTLNSATPTLNSAVNALFGISTTSYSLRGTGARPTSGAVYYASYEYTRPTADYNKVKRFYTPDSAYADVGYPSATNALAKATSICFDNLAPSVILVQVNDASLPGSPTQSEIKAALDAAAGSSSATEIIVLDTRLGVQTDLIAHIEDQSSVLNKNYRRGWFGMPAGTLIGDRDTPDTFVYRAVKTLQVAADSPGRGRLILVAPPSAIRVVVAEDGSQSDVTVDSTYIAAAIAARMTAFTSPSDTLLRKTIIGFKVDTDGSFPTYLKEERAMLASNGVTVVTDIGGRLVLTDPLTTEAGGGKIVTFQEISASTQKDGVSAAITETVDNNLVGVVPSDLSTFILTIKGYVAAALQSLIAQGAIGPFKTSAGVTRDIDLAKDIQVLQDRNDPTKFYFRYYFNLRLPAKRFFGDYSVNNPFWSA